MAEPRRWPALEVRSRDIDADGVLEGLVAAVLHDHPPLAIHDLHPPPVPPGGLWDPTAPPPPDPPPMPLGWRVCFADADVRAAAASAIEALAAELVVEALEMSDDDWVARSQATLTAVTAGRFVVAPPWDRPAAISPGQFLLVIEPSMGFGTGHHQTTRLCLAALSDLDVGGRSVLDLGTGSGVLAMAASLLGARSIRALDIDEDAIAAARQSATLNDLPTPVVFAVTDAFHTPPAPAEVVVANLTGAMLIRGAAALAAAVEPGGLLVVSGFVADERDGVEAALDAFVLDARRREDEWCAAVLRRR